MSNKLIYLASCYSVGNATPMDKELRFQEACRKTAELLDEGYFVFCPIAHSHPLAVIGGIGDSWAIWQNLDKAMLERCDELWVYKMPMWEQSTGITAEIAYAKELGKPIKYLEYDGS